MTSLASHHAQSLKKNIPSDSACRLYFLRGCKSFNVILIKGNFSTAVTATKSPVRHISPSGLLALLSRCQWNYPTREFCSGYSCQINLLFFPDSLLLSIFDLEKETVRKSRTIKNYLPATNEISFQITTKTCKEKKQLFAICLHLGSPIFFCCSFL